MQARRRARGTGLPPAGPQPAASARIVWLGIALLVGALTLARVGQAAPVEEARQQLLTGRYDAAIEAARQTLKERPDSDEWQVVLLDGLMTRGRYAEARAVVTNAVGRESRSLRLRWAAREVFFMNGEPAQAAAMVKDITEFMAARRWAYRDAPEVLAFGRAALIANADPKQVMDRIFENVKKADPSLREVYVAIGELALEKHDFALAAKNYQEGLKKLPNDPDLQFGLARAYLPSEPALAQSALESALKQNTNHVPSLLLLADRAIDAEDYGAAHGLLDQVLAVNPWQPEAWAYRVVLARLENEPTREAPAREAATKFWPTTPRVPHLIGRKLSQDYRFAEGAALQREALKYDPTFLPAKVQLAQDLLRLGEDDEGWRLAEAVHDKDGYDITALNLVTLRDTMRKYVTVTNAHFIVHLTPKEAALYGPRVVELLETARTRLGAKYGYLPERPVRIEMFADQKDFAVRTFGMPENHGFLGVCFGPVITANSPASRPGQPFNWEAMLWHEYCHVVTLQLTRNKMPRWLSEGISVYEERQASPAWGERLGPRYREMILGDDLTPVGRLSAAFMAPRTAVHLQFAYYECSLVIEFLVERYGFDRLTAILRDLGQGVAINAAITRHTVPIAEFEKAFATFARQRAEQLGPGLDWAKPSLETVVSGGPDAGAPRGAGLGEAGWAAWAKAHPTNYYVLSRQAAAFIEEKQWAAAKPILAQLVAACPDVYGAREAYAMLATVHRELGESGPEKAVLAPLAEKDDKALEAYQRLMEVAAAGAEWPVVVQNAHRYLAVNPLVPVPYRFLAQAAEQTDDGRTAIGAYRAWLALDPSNPAEVHYRLARQLHRAGDPGARRQVLQALEEAPRYRDALRLLLEIEAANLRPGTTNPPPPTVTSAAGHLTDPGVPDASPLHAFGSLEAQRQLERTVSPHPTPLPEGEGDRSTAFRHAVRARYLAALERRPPGGSEGKGRRPEVPAQPRVFPLPVGEVLGEGEQDDRVPRPARPRQPASEVPPGPGLAAGSKERAP